MDKTQKNIETMQQKLVKLKTRQIGYQADFLKLQAVIADTTTKIADIETALDKEKKVQNWQQQNTVLQSGLDDLIAQGHPREEALKIMQKTMWAAAGHP